MQEFENYLETRAGLSMEAIQAISGCASSRSFRRNELLFKAGDICRHKIFVAGGMLQTYNTTADGNDHIIQFHPELTWTLDVESYNKEIPSKVSIGAIEPTEVLLWEKSIFTNLLAEIPLLKKLSEELITNSTYYARQRIMTSLSATPEEKYEDFVATYPHYLNRLPLRMIASYLGISIKTLTRIRHAQLHR